MENSEYKMEELIPIVADLVKQYTGNESTSVTYEKAQQLMDAVIYCIKEYESVYEAVEMEDLPIALGEKSAGEAYRLGYQKVLEKVKQVQKQYNEMILDFHFYGNDNYRDTVLRALPGFFLYYDPQFAPQETIITMDYPTLCPVEGRHGIDAIEVYMNSICMEQKFMKKLPETYICEKLQSFHSDYRTQFFNLCDIIYRNILSCTLIGKRPDTVPSEEDYKKLEYWVQANSEEHIRKVLLSLNDRMVREKYEDDKKLGTYLSRSIEDFIVGLKHGAEYHCLPGIVVL